MNRVGNGVLGGWEMSTVTMWQTGPYLTPITSPAFDTANLNLVFRGAALRPDCAGNPVPTNQTVDEYFNINAFNPIPAPGRIGNCAVGSLVGPGTTAVAAGMSKTFQVHEGVAYDLRRPLPISRTIRISLPRRWMYPLPPPSGRSPPFSPRRTREIAPGNLHCGSTFDLRPAGDIVRSAIC